jgi:myo-inositol-1(or 4)-monophosphatase
MTQSLHIARRCAESIAREAGAYMVRERRAGFEIDLKGKNDLVTTIDIAVERRVTEQLAANFPDDAIFGEELGQSSGPEARRWVIDPIDGTLNFSTGVPFYCISIALQVDGESVVGVIYEPNRDELFTAVRGEGAWLDGKPMQVTSAGEIADSVLVTGFPPLKDGQKTDNLDNFVRASRASRAVRRLGSAALDLAYVAAGRMDGFWEFHLNPWDTAAGYLMVTEAGGRVTDVNGMDYTAYADSVVATNGAIHDALLPILEAS